MADLVNDTAKRQLGARNAEGSHLKSGSWEVLGGPGVNDEPGGASYKLDGGRGISQDTTIPKSVGPEGSNLKKDVAEDDEVDVKFDGDELEETDDLDVELDKLESVEPVDVDVEVKEDEDKDDDKKIDESEDEDDDNVVKEEDEDDEKKNPFAEEDEKDDDAVVKEEDEKDEKLDESEEDDEKKLDEEDDEDEKVVKESVKIRIKMPPAKLFESANLPAKSQKKVAVIFEQAIRENTKQIAKQLHGHYKKLHESKLAARDKQLAKQIDGYLSYVVEEWVKQNRVEIRQSLRVEQAEEFMNGLHKLFKESYIDVPESKVDVVKKLTEENNKLKKSVNEHLAQKMKLRKLAEAANKRRIVAEFARNLSESEAAKLTKLTEDVAYTNAKEFREKLSTLKESYFPKPSAKGKELPEANVQELKEEKKSTAGLDPETAAVMEALSRTAASDKW